MSFPAGYRPPDCFWPAAGIRHVPKCEMLAAFEDPAEALTLYHAQFFYARYGDPRVVAYETIIGAKVVGGEPLMGHELDWLAEERVRLDLGAFERKGVGWFLRWYGVGRLTRIAPWRWELCAARDRSRP